MTNTTPEAEPEAVVLLHGFSGTRRAWDGVVACLSPERCRPLALDLPGHGEYADAHARPISFAGCVAHVLARAPERFVLCGYSLGGRVALHVGHQIRFHSPDTRLIGHSYVSGSGYR